MITLRPFQVPAVESALQVFNHLAGQLATLPDSADRAAAVAHNGAILLHAPTGSGKTVMAGTIAHSLSHQHPVVWFWFTPFKGLVEQTEQSLRENFPALRTRRLADDRKPEDTAPGDVWVTTWQLVATGNTEGRRVRNTREDNPSVDQLISRLRQKGFRIGVIVDESHHGFRKATHAFEFYRDVIKPEFTLLVTATPNDKEAASFAKDAGFKRLETLAISRLTAVASGLVKPGVRSVALIARPGQENLVDFETTAIREAAKVHLALKAELTRLGIPLNPLMLVQVDSSPRSEKRAVKKLLASGFKENQIAVYTAKEPDANLRTLANDPRVEVLVFKMAVALGFDAPRAWTLVSMRGIVDQDFGTQIVGRLMRVHELCQHREMPDLLNHAYVFLADLESQKGLTQAADKINNVKDQLAQVGSYAVVVQIGGENQLQLVRNGTPSLFPDETQRPALTALALGTEPEPETSEEDADDPPPASVEGESPVAPAPSLLTGFFAEVDGPPPPTPGQPPRVKPVNAPYRYPLRADIPRRLLKETLRRDTTGLEAAIVAHIDLSAEVLLDGMRRAIEILRVERELFSTDTLRDDGQTRIQAALDRQATEEQALQLLLSMDGIADKFLLQELFTKRIADELRRLGRAEAENEDEVFYTQAMLMVQHRRRLPNALRRALAAYVEAVEADPLAEFLLSDTPLSDSARNSYGKLPPGLNTWETAFAHWLDTEAAEHLNWWHRNISMSTEAVVTVLPDGSRFFPDFILSLKGRQKPDGILLVDTKRGINDDLNAIPKTNVAHQKYGRAMILKKDGTRWFTIRYSEAHDKNEEDQILRPELLAHFV
jgi:type III restriction enzyme